MEHTPAFQVEVSLFGLTGPERVCGATGSWSGSIDKA